MLFPFYDSQGSHVSSAYCCVQKDQDAMESDGMSLQNLGELQWLLRMELMAVN